MAQENVKPDAMENAPQTEKQVSLIKVGLPLLLVQILIAYFLATYVLVPMFFDQAKANSYEEATKEDSEEEEEERSFGVIYQLEDLIVNPAQSDQFLLLNLALEVKEEDDTKILDERKVIVRDILIRILSGKTIDQLDGPEDKENLRNEIKESISPVLPKGHLYNVYFSNYIIQ